MIEIGSENDSYVDIYINPSPSEFIRYNNSVRVNY